jgi:hypothetical protein
MASRFLAYRFRELHPFEVECLAPKESLMVGANSFEIFTLANQAGKF